MAKQPAAVVGVGQTHHRAKREDDLDGGPAARLSTALGDAGITLDEIDAIVVGKAPDLFEGVMMPELFLAEALSAGQPPLRVHTAGSVGGSTAIVAFVARAGRRPPQGAHCRPRSGPESNAMWALSVPLPFNMPVHAGAGGFTSPRTCGLHPPLGHRPTSARSSRRKDRQNALKNPYAHLRAPTPPSSRCSPPRCLGPDPLRRTCPSSDGACAIVIVDEDTARASANPPGSTAPSMRSEATTPPSATVVSRASRRRGRSPVEAGGHHEPDRGDRRGRIYVPFSGSSRCGWSRSASPRRTATAGGSPSPGRPRWTADPGELLRRGARPTRSAPRACSGSARPRCRCAVPRAGTRSTEHDARWDTPTAAGRSSSPCGSWARRSRRTRRLGGRAYAGCVAELIPHQRPRADRRRRGAAARRGDPRPRGRPARERDRRLAAVRPDAGPRAPDDRNRGGARADPGRRPRRVAARPTGDRRAARSPCANAAAVADRPAYRRAMGELIAFPTPTAPRRRSRSRSGARPWAASCARSGVRRDARSPTWPGRRASRRSTSPRSSGGARSPARRSSARSPARSAAAGRPDRPRQPTTVPGLGPVCPAA